MLARACNLQLFFELHEQSLQPQREMFMRRAGKHTPVNRRSQTTKTDGSRSPGGSESQSGGFRPANKVRRAVTRPSDVLLELKAPSSGRSSLTKTGKSRTGQRTRSKIQNEQPTGRERKGRVLDSRTMSSQTSLGVVLLPHRYTCCPGWVLGARELEHLCPVKCQQKSRLLHFSLFNFSAEAFVVILS